LVTRGMIMTNEEVIAEIKKICANTQGLINILKQDPAVLSYNKLLGLNHKLSTLLCNLDNNNKD